MERAEDVLKDYLGLEMVGISLQSFDNSLVENPAQRVKQIWKYSLGNFRIHLVCVSPPISKGTQIRVKDRI